MSELTFRARQKYRKHESCQLYYPLRLIGTVYAWLFTYLCRFSDIDEQSKGLCYWCNMNIQRQCSGDLGTEVMQNFFWCVYIGKRQFHKDLKNRRFVHRVLSLQDSESNVGHVVRVLLRSRPTGLSIQRWCVNSNCDWGEGWHEMNKCESEMGGLKSAVC